jgi:predicted  nucleic acid-binding Zn-ribbon protein
MLYRDDETIGAYQMETAESLRALASRLRAAETRAENADPDQRLKYQKELDDLNWRLKEIETKLGELVGTDESEWEALRLEIDTALDELGRDIENAIS